jgi:hypothetical protein
MGNRRRAVGRAGNASKWRGTAGPSPVRRRPATTQADLRKMATRELLRRAALATPVLGGILILGLLAVSLMRGPSRPDTVVGSTTTVSGDLEVAAPEAETADETEADEAEGDTVTAGAEDEADDDAADEASGPSHDDPSDAESTGSGDEVAIGAPTAPRGPAPGSAGRPHDTRHGDDPADEDEADDAPVDVDVDDVVDVDAHESGRDGGRDAKPDGSSGVSVDVGPVDVSVGGPPRLGTPRR